VNWKGRIIKAPSLTAVSLIHALLPCREKRNRLPQPRKEKTRGIDSQRENRRQVVENGRDLGGDDSSRRRVEKAECSLWALKKAGRARNQGAFQGVVLQIGRSEKGDDRARSGKKNGNHGQKHSGLKDGEDSTVFI